MNDHLAAGDVLEVARRPASSASAPGDGDVVAFSAGSGITPVLSLLKTALATTSRRVRLLYANRDQDAVIFRSELDALRAAATPTASTLAHHLDVDRGFVGPDDVRRFAETARDAEFYVCGPGPFMDVVERTLLDARRRRRSASTSSGSPPTSGCRRPRPGDEAAGTTQVTIELDGRTESTEHRPGTTILQTARQMGLSPPFSCEAGSCATCMARLVEGTATMHVNNALTDDEVADGWVLTCQAVPTSPLGAGGLRLRGGIDGGNCPSPTSSRSSSCWPATPSA